MPKPLNIKAADFSENHKAAAQAPIRDLRQELARAIDEILSTNWAPLFVDPGLAGRDFSFDRSADLFVALSRAFPLMPAEQQKRVRSRLEAEWSTHAPFAAEGVYPLHPQGQGASTAPREWFGVPAEYRTRLGGDKQPHRFQGVYAAWLFGETCSARQRVDASWPAIRAACDEFLKSGWRLDGSKGDLYANIYLASLLATEKIATRVGDEPAAARARTKATETADALVAWWKRAGERDTLRTFNTSAELDPFIGKGDGLSFSVAPHRHKLALYRDLTPEVAAIVRSKAPEAVENLARVFNALYQTWWIMGEERQVHSGENFIDPPDLALSGFQAMAWFGDASSSTLRERIDMPFCRADLYHVQKLALALGR